MTTQRRTDIDLTQAASTTFHTSTPHHADRVCGLCVAVLLVAFNTLMLTLMVFPAACAATTESASPHQFAAFIDASGRGDLDTMNQLLTHALADTNDDFQARARFVDTPDAEHRTALTEAISGDHQGAIRWLLQQGADPDLVGQQRLAPLAVAVLYRRFYIARLLLVEGASPDPRDAHGSSPMHYAARSGDTRIQKLLLKYAAYVNLANLNRVTPLMDAIKHGHTDSVTFLLKNHANVHQRDKHGMNAEQRADRLGHIDIVEILNAHTAQLPD